MTRFRESVRSLLRERLLDAAYQAVTASGWPKVRMAQIAEGAGVSRQTVYTEFGSKDKLGQALVMREVERFLLGIQEQLDAHREDMQGAVAAAVRFTLDRAGDNPLLKSVLVGARGGQDDLMAFLTTRSEPLLETASTMLTAYAEEAWPFIDAFSRGLAVEAVVRMTVSHIVQPVATSEVTAARIAESVARIALIADK